MNSGQHLETAALYALGVLPSNDAVEFETHLSDCMECRRELESLRPILSAMTPWPTDVVRPPKPLWSRLADRIFNNLPGAAAPTLDSLPEPEWEDVAKGISVKILAEDLAAKRVTMLVRLAPGTEYPPHRHAGIEELYMLDGVLRVDEKSFKPGDFLYAEPGTVDHRVWSETGCTCVLMTSRKDSIL